MNTPQFNVPLIELESSTGHAVDLYNVYELVGSTIEGGDLAFTFVSDEKRGRLILRFRGVRSLHIEQPSDWMPEEASQIDHLLLRPQGPWRRVVFKAGGMVYEFDCSEVMLSWD